jgi:hypothetical protein
MKTLVFLFLAAVTLLAASVQSDEDLKQDFNYLTYYYLDPQPEKAMTVLEKFLSSEIFKSSQLSQNNADNTLAYSFGRIAQLSPPIISKYEDLFNRTAHNERLFILGILQYCGNEQVKAFLSDKLKDENFVEEKEAIAKTIKKSTIPPYNPLTEEVKGPGGLDFLWTEFMISGDERAVQKIISTLTWPDRARNKLDIYLKGPAATEQKKEIAVLLTTDYNISCDAEKQTIAAQEDMDIILSTALQKRQTPSESFPKFKDALALSQEDFLYMATKGAANWSLNGNAGQHKKVFEICDTAISKNTGFAKIALLKISAGGYLSIQNKEKAIDRLKQLVSLCPADSWAHFSLGSIYVENNNMKGAAEESVLLEKLDPESASMLADEVEFSALSKLDIAGSRPADEKIDVPAIIRGVIEKHYDIKSYRTRLTFRDLTQITKNENGYVVEWNAKYASPDRFFVSQNAKESGEYDRWITIGKDHYFQIGGWFRDPEENAEWRNNINKLLPPEKWKRLMQNSDITMGKIVQAEQKKYVIFNFSPKTAEGFGPVNFGAKAVYSSEIWIEYPSLFIAKAILKIKGENEDKKDVNLQYCQLFRDYNSNIKIDKPEQVLAK